jgi:hypothetical protein
MTRMTGVIKHAPSISTTPLIGTIGLNTPNIPGGSFDFGSMSNWAYESANKLITAPNTPTSGSLTPLNLNNPFNDNPIGEAINRLTNRLTDLDEVTDNISATPDILHSNAESILAERLNNIKDLTPKPSYASIVSKNKFDVLTEENILDSNADSILAERFNNIFYLGLLPKF